MDYRTLSVIALSNRDFPSFAAKISEAIKWLEYAKAQGTDLAVYPETINIYRGDGPDNPQAMSLQEAALEDWQGATASLREAAQKLSVALVLPVLIRENGQLANVFFLISRDGRLLGRFQKLYPTEPEREAGLLPGKPLTIDWEGLPVSGAICFDTNFIDIFATQANLGAKLFIVPSLWNGGPWLEGLAARFATPMAIAYPAWSRIIDLDGRTKVSGGYRQETVRFGFGAPVYTTTLNFDREVFHLNDQAGKIVDIQKSFPGTVRVNMLHEQAAFSVESKSDSITVAQIMRDYALIPFRDYLTDQSL